jgi:mannosylglucosylglycerate synthase
MKQNNIGILHYSVPPVIGGVEAVIKAHSNLFEDNGYKVTIISGKGDPSAFSQSVDFHKIPELDSTHPIISNLNQQLEVGIKPSSFELTSNNIGEKLTPILYQIDALIIHNIFTKHFNLPLTAAIHNLLDQKVIQNCIAWCHDFTWTSPNSRHKVFPGYPWDLLRKYRNDIKYIVVSKERQRTLANLFKVSEDEIQVIYNGINADILLGFSSESSMLTHYLGLFDSDLNILMPVRITQAKNIEFALKVVSEIKTYGVNVKCIVTGPPDPHDPKNMDYFNNLRKIRLDLNLENDFHFIYESNSNQKNGYIINDTIVGDLYRISDILFMPSHREGFGMPVLEAGFVGLPIITTPIPASNEIAKENANIFSLDLEPKKIAIEIIEIIKSNPITRLKIETRKNYTWESIFKQKIIPILSN